VINTDIYKVGDDMLLEAYRGNTLPIPMTATDPSGVPIDFTGATVEFRLNFPVRITEATTGVTIDRTTRGSINVTVDDSLTLVPPRVYACSLTVTFLNGTRITYYSIDILIKAVA